MSNLKARKEGIQLIKQATPDFHFLITKKFESISHTNTNTHDYDQKQIIQEDQIKEFFLFSNEKDHPLGRIGVDRSSILNLFLAHILIIY